MFTSDLCGFRFFTIFRGWPGLERGTSETPGLPSLRSVQPRPPCHLWPPIIREERDFRSGVSGALVG